jgi:hypothetical protein
VIPRLILEAKDRGNTRGAQNKGKTAQAEIRLLEK